MSPATKKYLSKGSRAVELIRDCEEALAYWEQREQERPCEINRFNIEYFRGFIEYIKQNLSEETAQ